MVWLIPALPLPLGVECLAWDVISASKTQNTPAQWQTKPAIAQGYPIHHARACLAGQKQRQQRGAPVSTASRLSSLSGVGALPGVQCPPDARGPGSGRLFSLAGTVGDVWCPRRRRGFQRGWPGWWTSRLALVPSRDSRARTRSPSLIWPDKHYLLNNQSSH